MKYDKDELQMLCEQVDLVEYAGKTLDLKKDGTLYRAHCPLHIDKTASLTIYPETNTFYCFSCAVNGRIIEWLRTFEGLSYDESVEKTARLVGTDISSLKTSDTVAFFKTLNQKGKSKEIDERNILDWSQYEKYDDEIPQEWVKEGISEETLKTFEIRVDKSSNRIVYPVYDNDLKLIGVKGRTRFENYKSLKIMKYMNYYPIGSVDYFAGMKQCRDEIIKTKKVIIFEGIKSVMKMWSWGYHNCLATETSHINAEQIKLLIKMGLKEVVIAYDKGVDKIDVGMLKRFTNVYVIKDKHGLLEDKDAPVDKGKDVWERLYSERVRL